jgi:hypothetical protein
MSRHNKVNKDHYVQRGRLTPDEAARELAKMRQVGSQHTWQPTKKDALPRRESKDPADGTETTEDNESKEVTSPEVESQPAARATKGVAPMKKAAKSNAKSPKLQAAKTRPAKKTVKAKSGNSAKPTGGKLKRKAVLARNVGGGGATPRAAKRGKS